MTPILQHIPPKKFIGSRLTMSFAQNRTTELWRTFMPLRKEITNAASVNLYSIQLYREGFFDHFDPTATFEKWAAVEISDSAVVPDGLEAFIIPGGLYAVFNYKGTAEEAAPFYQAIFMEWLPGSKYALDTRPHFEVMGSKYKHGDPESEEEIWIPVAAR